MNPAQVQQRIYASMNRLAKTSRALYRITTRFLYRARKSDPNKHDPTPVYVGLHKDKCHFILGYNPYYIDQLSDEKLDGILMHEALHPLLLHLSQRRPEECISEPDKAKRQDYLMISNWAMDIALNQLLPIKNVADDWLMPDRHGFNLPKLQSMEYYWQKLKAEYDADPQAFKEKHKNIIGDGHEWSDQGEVLDPDLEKFLDDVGQDVGIKGGDDPNFEKLGKTLFPNKPELDWKKIIKTSASQKQSWEKISSRLRPNRRFGFAMPGSKNLYNFKKWCVAIDISPSVYSVPGMLETFHAELSGLLEYVQADVVWFGSEIHMVVKNARKRKSFEQVQGFGTNFQCVLDYYNKNKDLELLVIVTDGEASAIKPPLHGSPNNVLWVLPNKNYRPPVDWGRRVYIKP